MGLKAANSQLKLSNQQEGEPHGKKTSDQVIRDTHTEELVLGLCGPIGSPIHEVAQTLSTILKRDFAYECHIVRLSRLIEKFGEVNPTANKFGRYRELITSGNELRVKHGTSVLADLAIGEIAAKRSKRDGQNPASAARVVHIIDSIKNEGELNALRLIYRDMFYLIGVASPLSGRVSRLQNDGGGMSLSDVHQLIDTDSGEEIENGQTVRDTYPKADFFLRTDGQTERMEKGLIRFLDLICGSKPVSPTTEETSIYYAASAAKRSACLSRQVGAAITNEKGLLLAVGWNDVPRFGGGLYDQDDDQDKRCVRYGQKCFNHVEKDEIAEHIGNHLLNQKAIGRKQKEKVIAALLKSRLNGLLEFSRAIHAEMMALIDASQTAGTQVKGGTLYCTTYPCHVCARHIVAAGITRVVYIEPYRKSLAIKLHGDAIEEEGQNPKKVQLLPFEGVAPGRFNLLFHALRRKDDNGKASLPGRTKAKPKAETTLESLPVLEGLILNRLKQSSLIETEGGGSDHQNAT